MVQETWWKKCFNLLELIKFTHTIFAFPFALISMMVASKGLPPLTIFGWIAVCMVGARTAAMGFNRYLDWEIDQKNPRTVGRSKLATRKGAFGLTVFGVAVFFVGTLYLNKLCVLLFPVALILVLGYSALKRLTVWCHLGLGLALSAAPMGAWAAVTGSLIHPAPWILAFAVMTWVFGFDLIYATQDAEYDRRAGLYSIPAKWGVKRALLTARILHGLTFVALVVFGRVAGLSDPYRVSLVFVAGALYYEHRLCRETSDLGRINQAFFLMNGIIGIVLFAGVAWSVLVN